MVRLNQPIFNLPEVTKNNNNIKNNNVEAGKKFADIFSQVSEKNNELKFSAHAKARMQERGISLDDSQKQKLEQALTKAEEKGAVDCLVMLENNAFVVSVKNRTVITAVDEDSMRGNIFTNIDSAILSF